MKRRIIYCSLVLLCFLINTQGQINHQVVFPTKIKVTEERLDDQETYTRVLIPGLPQTDSIGYPALPVKYIKLLIPVNAYDLSIEVKATKMQKHKLRYKVEPLQEPIPIGFYPKPDFVRPVEKKYDSYTPYPSKLAEIVEKGNFKGDHLVTIAVYPCQYFPKLNELDVIETVDFTLNYKENKNEKSIAKNQVNTRHKKILEKIIDNPSDINKFSTIGESSELNSIPVQTITSTLKNAGEGSGITVDCDYVVVTSQSLASAFNEFMAWKRRKGIDIELVTIEDINASYTGDNISGINDIAGKLRQFLSEFYNPERDLQYVLLGGDNTILPVRHAHCNENTTDDYYIIPTDIYFADFHGDWEVDNDERYGEPSDSVDFNPEIYVGRVMVSNADEVRNWTKKVLLYEKKPGNGNYEYLTRAFFTQADQL